MTLQSSLFVQSKQWDIIVINSANNATDIIFTLKILVKNLIGKNIYLPKMDLYRWHHC